MRPIEPLSESVFLILLSLVPGPKHGYAIIQDVERLSSRRLRLSTGTLFGAIKRMLAEDWITLVASDHAPRGRKTYRLTAAGRIIIQTEYRRLRGLVTVAQTQIGERDES